MGFGFYTRHSAGQFTNLISVQVPRLVTAFDRFNRFQSALITVVAYFIFAFPDQLAVREHGDRCRNRDTNHVFGV
jgi:hypothetical protein